MSTELEVFNYCGWKPYSEAKSRAGLGDNPRLTALGDEVADIDVGSDSKILDHLSAQRAHYLYPSSNYYHSDTRELMKLGAQK